MSSIILTKLGPNVQVSQSSSTTTRAESDIAVDPAIPTKLVGASKRFPDRNVYQYQADVYISLDAGSSWQTVSLPPYVPPGYTLPANLSDPVVSFTEYTSTGNEVCVAFNIVPGELSDNPRGVSIVVYRSPDGGWTWHAPVVVHQAQSGGDDDKQSICSYENGLVLAWDDAQSNTLRFARNTFFQGSEPAPGQWYGVGTNSPGVGFEFVTDSFSPEVVFTGEYMFIVWVGRGTAPGTSGIKVVVSSDYGFTFSPPKIVADNIGVYSGISFPGANFRVYTSPSVCKIGLRGIMVAWADSRYDSSYGTSIIHYALTRDGESWISGSDGTGIPIFGPRVPHQHYNFHPRLAITHPGVVSDSFGLVGCAFYRYYPPSDNLNRRMEVVLLVTDAEGGSVSSTSVPVFDSTIIVTDQPFDPEIDPQVAPAGKEFFGDYFGHAANDKGFFPFWTDTRTGLEEIFVGYIEASYPASAESEGGQLGDTSA